MSNITYAEYAKRLPSYEAIGVALINKPSLMVTKKPEDISYWIKPLTDMDKKAYQRITEEPLGNNQMYAWKSIKSSPTTNHPQDVVTVVPINSIRIDKNNQTNLWVKTPADLVGYSVVSRNYLRVSKPCQPLNYYNSIEYLRANVGVEGRWGIMVDKINPYKDGTKMNLAQKSITTVSIFQGGITVDSHEHVFNTIPLDTNYYTASIITGNSGSGGINIITLTILSGKPCEILLESKSSSSDIKIKSIKGLPSNLTFDSDSDIISGIPMVTGSYDCEIVLSNDIKVMLTLNINLLSLFTGI